MLVRIVIQRINRLVILGQKEQKQWLWCDTEDQWTGYSRTEGIKRTVVVGHRINALVIVGQS